MTPVLVPESPPEVATFFKACTKKNDDASPGTTTPSNHKQELSNRLNKSFFQRLQVKSKVMDLVI